MSNTVFVNGTVVQPSWLNDVNNLVYFGKDFDGFTFNVKDPTYGAKGDGVTDDTAAIQAAITAASVSGNARVLFPGTTSFYKISSSLDCRNLSTLQMSGWGLPTIQSSNLTAPIILSGGERQEFSGLKLQFASLPTNAQTSAVAIRCYNMYESIITRCYINQVYTGIDQFQGLVNGGQNAFYSNCVSNTRIVQWSGYAIDLLPFSGGNSGNRFDNLYCANRNGPTPSTNTICIGGVRMSTSQDGVWNEVNVEWCRNTGPLVTLNQCANPVINGLHFEGNQPQTTFTPLIEILGGDGSAPTFQGLTLAGNDFSLAGGASACALFRANAGVRLKVNGITANTNTTPANCALFTNGGTTAYGSYLSFDDIQDLDGSLSIDTYTPKASYGTPTALVESPLQQYNLYITKHSSMISDNAGGTNSSVAVVPGSVAAVFNDAMSLYDTSNTRWQAKQSGNYSCFVTVPTASSASFQIKKNGTTISGVSVGTGGGGAVTLSLARNDTIQIVLAAGSYTRTNCTFGISLAS